MTLHMSFHKNLASLNSKYEYKFLSYNSKKLVV